MHPYAVLSGILRSVYRIRLAFALHRQVRHALGLNASKADVPPADALQWCRRIASQQLLCVAVLEYPACPRTSGVPAPTAVIPFADAPLSTRCRSAASVSVARGSGGALAVVLSGTGRYWAVLGGTGRYWAVLSGTGRYEVVLGGTKWNRNNGTNEHSC